MLAPAPQIPLRHSKGRLPARHPSLARRESDSPCHLRPWDCESRRLVLVQLRPSGPRGLRRAFAGPAWFGAQSTGPRGR